MFKTVTAKVDFVKLEKTWLSRWSQSGLVKKYLHKNDRSDKRFSFFDGPITANNPMGVHHAWGRVYKDLWQRYFNMKGCRQRFQNGFDCQGLWVEVEVEKDLGFKAKKDIEKFGLANFANECKKRVAKYSKVQTEESIRLGQFMDWDNSYYTYTDTNIEYIWNFLKKCYENGWLYKGFRALPWCARCGTSLSEHELYDSYKQMTHRSVYLKFPVAGEEDSAFLVWTTTPWTLPANVALAVHPDFKYLRVKTDRGSLILAESLLKVVKGKYQILEKVRGTKLVGVQYQSPFSELPAQEKTQKKVILWKEVSGEDGTGIVHIAPGCGEEDFKLGQQEKLTVIVPLNEDGVYTDGYGEFTGKFAGDVADMVFDSLKKKELLYEIADITHSYPICWRCKEPIVFRAEENWFISAKEIRPKMKKEAKKVKWHPAYAGKLMQDWLTNMGDWNISRKRYFGLPLPFYECSCGQQIVIGSRAELRKMAIDPRVVDQLSELHRPWIDEVKIKCPKCHRPVSRITDIGDCWLDAGIVPFSTLHYLTNKSSWQAWFPADWISEMREQIRLWFYSMLFMSVTLENRTPYLEVTSYEKVYDEKGKPMHKSAGNAIWFAEAAEKMGVDVMRWLYVTQNPELNLNFGYRIADETRRRFHLILWNVYNFFIARANADGWQKVGEPAKSSHVLDQWIMSLLNQLVKQVTDALDRYDAFTASHALENFVIDLSTWYVRRSRERGDKNNFHWTLWEVLATLAQLLAPFMPFLAEEIYHNLTNDESSVHLADWPTVGKIDKRLLSEMAMVRKICELGNARRKEVGIRTRQPLNQLRIANYELRIKTELVSLIKDELNVKKVVFRKGKGKLKAELDTKITRQLLEEGKMRDLIRQIQELRKKAGLDLNSPVTVAGPWFPATPKLRAFLQQKVLAKELVEADDLRLV